MVKNKDAHSCRLVRVVAAAATSASHSSVSSSAAGSLIAADADPSAPAASTGVPVESQSESPSAVETGHQLSWWCRRLGATPQQADVGPESPDGNRTVYRKKKPSFTVTESGDGRF